MAARAPGQSAPSDMGALILNHLKADPVKACVADSAIPHSVRTDCTWQVCVKLDEKIAAISLKDLPRNCKPSGASGLVLSSCVRCPRLLLQANLSMSSQLPQRLSRGRMAWPSLLCMRICGNGSRFGRSMKMIVSPRLQVSLYLAIARACCLQVNRRTMLRIKLKPMR